MQRAETPSTIFEFGGPRVYSYEEFLRAVAHQAGLARPTGSNPDCRLACTRMGLEMFPVRFLPRAIRWN